MLRIVFIIICGLSLALNIYLLQQEPETSLPDESHRALVRANRKIAHLENEIEILLRQEPALKAAAEERAQKYSQNESRAEPIVINSDLNDSAILAPDPEMRVELKLGAISRIVSLSDQERQELRDLFLNDHDNTSDQQLLTQVIGEERAEFYKETREQAFSKGRQEELEKEALYLSRKLDLEPAEEQSLRSVLTEIDDEISEWRRARSQQLGEQSGAAPGVKMQVLIEEIIVRRDLMKSRLSTLLGADKFKQYLQLEAESSAADMETFHVPPTGDQ